MSAGEPEQEVGSVGEEAAKLFDAFSEVFGTGRAEQGATTGAYDRREDVGRARWGGEGLAALAADAISALRDADAHVSTGGEDCRICPVCRAIHAVRGSTPEVRAHLVTAARSLLAAGSALVDQIDLPPGSPGSPGSPGPGVERIDLDDLHQPQDQHDDQDEDQHGAHGSQEEHR